MEEEIAQHYIEFFLNYNKGGSVDFSTAVPGKHMFSWKFKLSCSDKINEYGNICFELSWASHAGSIFLKPMIGMTFHSFQTWHFIPMGMKWAHFIPIWRSKAFHSGQNWQFIPLGMKWIDFIFIGIKLVHLISDGMNLAFHSSWKSQEYQFLPPFHLFCKQNH